MNKIKKCLDFFFGGDFSLAEQMVIVVGFLLFMLIFGCIMMLIVVLAIALLAQYPFGAFIVALFLVGLAFVLHQINKRWGE